MNRRQQLTSLAAVTAMVLPTACGPVDNKGVENTPAPRSIPSLSRSTQLYNGLQGALAETESQEFNSPVDALAYFLNEIEPFYTNCDLYGIQWSGRLYLAPSASGYSVFKEDSLDPGNCVELVEVSTMDPSVNGNKQAIEAITLLIIAKELMHGPAATYVQDLETSGQLSFSSDEERAVLVDGLATLSLTQNQRINLYSSPSRIFILENPRLQIFFIPGQSTIDDSVIEAVNLLRETGVLGSLKDGRPASIDPLRHQREG